MWIIISEKGVRYAWHNIEKENNEQFFIVEKNKQSISDLTQNETCRADKFVVKFFVAVKFSFSIQDKV